MCSSSAIAGCTSLTLSTDPTRCPKNMYEADARASIWLNLLTLSLNLTRTDQTGSSGGHSARDQGPLLANSDGCQGPHKPRSRPARMSISLFWGDRAVWKRILTSTQLLYKCHPPMRRKSPKMCTERCLTFSFSERRTVLGMKIEFSSAFYPFSDRKTQ